MKGCLKHIGLTLLLVLPWGCQREGIGLLGTDVLRFSNPSIATKVLAGQEITGDVYPVGENFSVYADKSSAAWNADETMPAHEAYMTAVECTYAGGASWEPISIYTWDGMGDSYPYLHAQAFSPSGTTGLTHSWTSGFTLTNFQTPAVGSMIDLMVSDRAYNYQKSTKAGHVDLHFRHVLSSIVFMVALHSDYQDMTETEVRLTSFRLRNVFTQGSFSQGLKSVNIDPDVNDPYDSGYPRWTTGDVESTLSGFMPLGQLQPANYLSNDNWIISDEALLLIPQPTHHERVAPAVSTDIEVEMGYSIAQGDGETITGTLTAPLTGISTWTMGKRHTYRIYFQPNQLTVNLRIEPWSAEEKIQLQ